MFSQTKLILLLIVAFASVGLCACSEGDREVTTSSDLAYASYEEGVANIERFRLPEARDHFEAALEEDPEFAMGWAQLAIVRGQLGESEASKEALNQAYELRANASEVEQLWIARLHALRDHDTEAGKAAYEQLTELYPDHPWVLRLRAGYAHAKNDFDEAMKCYDRILQQDPEAVAIHNLKGYLYLAQGEYDKAVLSLERYAYYAPDQANPHDSLGEAYLHIGRFDDAIDEFRSALEIDPAFLWSAKNLADALSTVGQNRAAVTVLETFQPVFEERNMYAWWDSERTRVAVRSENWEEVLTLTERSLNRLSEMDFMEKLEYELFARYARSIAYLESGSRQAAQEALGELTRVATKLYEQEGLAEYERPKQQFAINAAMTQSRFNRADGAPEVGIPALQTALDDADLSPYYLSRPARELALAQLESGQAEAAIVTARKILNEIPTQPELNLVLARSLAEAGQHDEAIEALRVYLDVMKKADADHPGLVEATALLQRLVPRS